MIVRCVYQLVHSQYSNIRSGWTNIFAVLHLIASSLNEAIVDMAFETCHFTVKTVFKEHLRIVVDAFQVNRIIFLLFEIMHVKIAIVD